MTLDSRGGAAAGAGAAPTARSTTCSSKAYQWRSIGPGSRRPIDRRRAASRDGRRSAYSGQTGGGLWKTIDGGESLGAGHRRSGAQLVGRRRRRFGDQSRHRVDRHGRAVHPRQHPAGRRRLQVDRRRQDVDAHRLRSSPTRSRASASIRPTPTSSSSPTSAATASRATSAACSRRPTAARPGARCSSATTRPARSTSQSIRNNPDVMFAAMWEAFRVEYSMSSGGPGSGLFKSTDGGEHWTEITRNPGLPAGIDGKIGVAVSGADSNRVYAIVENENGGLFSSDDAGATWKLVNDGRNHPPARVLLHARHRGSEEQGHRLRAERRHVLVARRRQDDGQLRRRRLARSLDRSRRHQPHRPRQRQRHGRVVQRAGGAAHLDGARLPDGAVLPRDLDRARARTTSAARSRTAAPSACRATPISAAADAAAVAVAAVAAARRSSYSPGGAEPGYIAPDPKNPDIFYAGGNNGIVPDAARSAHRQSRARSIRIRASSPASRRATLVERWQWTYPIIFSPADPTVLYTSSQHVWRTTNGGDNWDKISGDLTRHDPKTMGDSGGPITHDMNSPEVYGTVFALGPGKKDVNILWAGSDDGLVNVTRDGGKTWTNVTPKEMPDFGRVSIIDASLVRSRRGLRRGEEAAARPTSPLHLPHARLRQDLDEDRHRHSAGRLRPLGPRGSDAHAACSTPARSTASTFPTTTAITGSRCR